MRKISRKFVALLLAAILAFGVVETVNVSADVRIDFDEAEKIDINTKIKGELTEKSGEEYDVYRFTTGKGEVTKNWYCITFKDMKRQNANVVGANLYLYDEDMNEIDYIEASSKKETYIYEKLDNETDYYIVVKHKTNTGNPCEYYFKVEERKDEAGGGIKDAAEIKVNTEYKSFFQVPGEYDVYKFIVTTTEQKIRVKNCIAKANVTKTLYWDILDEDGAAVKDVDDTFWGVSAEESKEYDVKLAPGVYYIRFKGNSCINHDEDGKYVFSIEDAGKDTAMTLISLTMSKGDSITLEAFFADKDAECTWSSSKTSVVKVTSAGKLSAKKKGTAKITCMNKKNGMKMVLKVVVK